MFAGLQFEGKESVKKKQCIYKKLEEEVRNGESWEDTGSFLGALGRGTTRACTALPLC